MATILTKKKDTSGAPSAGDLTNSTGGAELAVNTADKRLYTKDSGGNVVEVGINPTSITTGTLNTSGAVVFNDAGADVDFRVEGDTEANLLFVDASADNVGVATSTPSTRLEVIASSGTSTAITRLKGGTTSGTRGFEFATDANGNVVMQGIRSSDNATGYQISINPSGGDVGIGTTSTAGYKMLLSDGTTSTAVHAGGGATYFGSVSSSPVLFISGNSERVRIDSSGNLLVGTTVTVSGGVAGSQLHPDGYIRTGRGSTSLSNQIEFYNPNGQVGKIQTTGTSTVYATSSDYRLKENIAPMTGALEKILELKPCTYTWKVDGSSGEGFIAHELQEIFPSAATGDKDGTEIQQVQISPAIEATYDEEGNELTPAVEAVYEEREVPVYQGVDTSFLVATLTAAIQELKAELDAAKERIAALENA